MLRTLPRAAIDGGYLPAPAQGFTGEIELNASQPKSAWPARIVPPEGAPNVLLIMTDDVGFAAPSTLLVVAGLAVLRRSS